MKALHEVLVIAGVLICLWAAGRTAAAMSSADPFEIHLQQRLLPPSGDHWLGTDELGRDLFSRVARGYCTTLSVSILAFLSSFVVGTLLGAWAGYQYDGPGDRVFNWVCSLIFSLPFLLIVASLMSILPRTLGYSYAVLTAVMWVAPARIVRAGVLQARESPCVLMERSLGKSEARILLRTLIPLTVRPAFVYSFRYFPEVVGLEAGLSFLGLGVQPPEPGLGRMIFDGIGYLSTAWWYAGAPAFSIFVITFFSSIVWGGLTKYGRS